MSRLQDLLSRHPHRVPVIIRSKNASLLPERTKFLVPEDVTMAQFLRQCRLRKSTRRPFRAIFALVNNTLPRSDSTMREMYTAYTAAVGADFLYVDIAEENFFGCFSSGQATSMT